MKPYQHPLTDQALIALNFYPIRYMPYPAYKYDRGNSYTDLQLSYQDELYIISGGRPIGVKTEYYRGDIATTENWCI